MSNRNKKLVNMTMPKLGEVEIYVAHIGKDDYPTIRKYRDAFNLILRYCGGMPITDHDPMFCASIAFTSNLYREDFTRELLDKLGVTAAIDFRRTYIDRIFLPPPSTASKDAFSELTKRTAYERDVRKALQEERGETPYIYPSGKLAQ